MHEAIQTSENSTKGIMILMKYGADLSIKDSEGKTVFFYLKNVKATKVLLSEADKMFAKESEKSESAIHPLNIKGPLGQTPIFEMVKSQRQLSVFKTMLENDHIDIWHVDNNGNSILH